MFNRKRACVEIPPGGLEELYDRGGNARKYGKAAPLRMANHGSGAARGSSA